MDPSRLLVLVAVVMPAFECSETAKSGCKNFNWEGFKLLEGEAFYVVPYALSNPDLPDGNITWYKNSSQIENISSDEKDRVHHHGGALFFFNLVPADSGSYIGRQMNPLGQCYNHRVKIEVFNASYRGDKKLNYGEIKNSDQNKNIPCPDPVNKTCKKLQGKFTWYKDFSLLQGQHEANLRLQKATKDDKGIYTCMCTWTHNGTEYNSSGSKELILLDPVIHKLEILSPTVKEQFADEGSGIQLNCSFFCGFNAIRDCDASWYFNGNRFTQMDGYSQTVKTVTQSPSKKTISTAILTIEKVSAEDFHTEFECFGRNFYSTDNIILTLKPRETITPVVIGGVCVLFFCVFAAILVKCYAIDLALFFRPYFHLSDHSKDTKLYDAYVVYQMQRMDKVTEDTLSQFVTKILPSVLENKCGYRLFIHGRDDIPGEDRLELVEDCVRQSRRLMVILTPGSGSEVTDQSPASPQTSVIGGFDWQVGLHHAVVQGEMSVILVQLGDTGPQGYAHLPPGLQMLVRQSAPIRWPQGTRDAVSWNSYFWKRVRYLMPAMPAKKCEQSAIV